MKFDFNDFNEYSQTKLQNLLITFQIPFALISVPISFYYNLSCIDLIFAHHGNSSV